MTCVHCRAAVAWADSDRWSVETIEIDPPRPGEVLVRMLAAGLCQTDQVFVRGGFAAFTRPVIGGHEGVGVVEEVGASVRSVRPGDQVLFLIPGPPCGRCHPCSVGLRHLCDTRPAPGRQFSDGTARHRARGVDAGLFVSLGLFAEYTVVHEDSLLPIAPELTPAALCPLACAGVTGWGAVQNAAALRPGEVAVVVGIGGVGANAVQAARALGAQAVLAVDPLDARRRLAVDLGADGAVADVDGARELVAEWTQGRMADAVVMTAGGAALVGPALAVLGKRGRLVVVGAHEGEPAGVTMSLRELQESEKQIRGCLAGSWHAREGARVLLDLAARGRYDPAAIVSRTYPLSEIERGYADQAAGAVVRAVLDLAGAAA
jgi:S-(hydroxymethyl)glutathione dehydrogenase/alcohol dehydrogenase